MSRMLMTAQASSVLTLLRSATSWLLGWALVTFFIELGILGTVSLGSHFGLMVTAVAPLFALPITVLAAKIIARINSQPDELSDEEAKTRRRKFTAIATVVFLMMLVLTMAPTVMDHQSRSLDAAAALQSFSPLDPSSLDSADLERTLAEFERARHELGDQWLIPDSSPLIVLFLFRDEWEYRNYTRANWGIEYAGGHAICSPSGATVGVPLEDASSLLKELPASTTPLHEMVHATWCQKLGQTSFYSIPAWFHEGVAERYQNEGWRQIYDRPWNRWMVWINRESLLPANEFCGFEPRDNADEIALFYGTAYEFIRSLEAEHGIKHLNAIVNDIEAGMGFDDSLRDRLGGTCSELYGEWSQSF